MAKDITSTLSQIEKSLSSLHQDVDALKEGHERDTLVKSPQRVCSDLPALMNVDDNHGQLGRQDRTGNRRPHLSNEPRRLFFNRSSSP